MKTYISFIRGINVTGHKLLKMEALRKMYEGMHFRNVRTYIQSGNVIFQDESSELKGLENIIKDEIKKGFGYEVTVLVMTIEELESVVQRNPFQDDGSKENPFMHVTFLASEPETAYIDHIKGRVGSGEAYALNGKAVYLYCPNGYGKTKLKNDVLERILKVRATTRTWRTTLELLKIAQNS